MRRIAWRALGLVILVGWVMAGLFASATSPLGEVAPVRIPFWVLGLGDIGAAALLTLLLIELRRVMVGTVAAAVAATVIYGALVVSPALLAAPSYVTLSNLALTQMVAVFFLSLFLGLMGALLGTIINSAARGYEL